MNAQQQWEELNDRVESLMAEEGVRNLADAFDEIRRRYPHLRDAKYPGTSGVAKATPASAARAAATPTFGGSAEQELERRAKRIAAERRCTFADAYVEALNADHTLYVRYLKEQQVKIEAASRRA